MRYSVLHFSVAAQAGLTPLVGNVMTDDQDINRYFSGTIYRVLSGLFGVFLIVVGIYAIFFGVVDLFARASIGLAITLLGAEALWSSVKSKPSWLAKLGPFI